MGVERSQFAICICEMQTMMLLWRSVGGSGHRCSDIRKMRNRIHKSALALGNPILEEIDEFADCSLPERFRDFFIVVVKKTFCCSNVFFYNHLYQPDRFYQKRYNIEVQTGHNY